MENKCLRFSFIRRNCSRFDKMGSLRSYFSFSRYLKQHMIGDVLTIERSISCMISDVNNSKLPNVNYLSTFSVSSQISMYPIFPFYGLFFYYHMHSS